MTSRTAPSRLITLPLRLLGNCIGAQRLCVLTYHRILAAPDPLLESEVDLATFRWQMQLLADGFNVLPLHQALQRLEQGRLPPRAVCITFDDGYRSTYEMALPVLQALGLSATVFSTTAHLDGGSMWNDRIIEAVRHLPDGPLDWRGLNLPLKLEPLMQAQSRLRIAASLNHHAKYLLPDEREQLISALEKFAGITAVPDLMLNPDMLRGLSRNGIEIGGHTVGHPILSKLDDARSRREIVDNKQTLEHIIGQPLRLFAYPNGKVGIDYDERHVHMVKQAGYEAAFTTANGSATRESDHFEIPRSRPWDASPLMFGLRLLRWLANKGV